MQLDWHFCQFSHRPNPLQYSKLQTGKSLVREVEALMRSDCGRHSVRLALVGVMLSTLFSLFTRPVLGKPQDASQSDLQQMQKKVDQLEQQLQELKQQMA